MRYHYTIIKAGQRVWGGEGMEGREEGREGGRKEGWREPSYFAGGNVKLGHGCREGRKKGRKKGRREGGKKQAREGGRKDKWEPSYFAGRNIKRSNHFGKQFLHFL